MAKAGIPIPVAGGSSMDGTGARTKAGTVATPVADKGGNKTDRAPKMKPSDVCGPC